MYLFFDTETNRFPNGKIADDHIDQCSPVQLAALLTTAEGREVGSFSVIINNRRKITQEAFEIHGISRELATKVGVPLKSAAQLFTTLLGKANKMVGHNLAFDLRVLRLMLAQADLPAETLKAVLARLDSLETVCTMKECKNIVKIPPTHKMMAANRKEFKAPSLEEAYRFFFGKDFENAHDANADVHATADVFFAIQEHRDTVAATATVQHTLFRAGHDDEALAV